MIRAGVVIAVRHLPFFRQTGGGCQAAPSLAHGFGQRAEFDEQGLQDQEPDAEVDAAQLILRDTEDQQRKQGEQDGSIEKIGAGIAPRIAACKTGIPLQQGLGVSREKIGCGPGSRPDELVSTGADIKERAAVGGVKRTALVFFGRPAEAGEYEPQEVEQGQQQGDAAEHAREQPGGKCRDEADGKYGEQGADVEVAQFIGSCQEVVQKFSLTGGSAAQRQDGSCLVIEGEPDFRQDAEGHAVREIAFAIAEDGAADAAGPYGGDAERQRVQGRHECGRGDEPGRGAEQRQSREESDEAHQKDGQKLWEGGQLQEFSHMHASPS